MSKPRKPSLARRAQALATLEKLEEVHATAEIALNFANPLELLVATILSAQCTDVRVNLVTEKLFERYRTAKDYATADLDELMEIIRSTGFYRNKARNIIAAARQIVEKHDGEVPPTMVELNALAGVGRKTANVVLGNAFDTPGMVVDTHVGRVSRRLGWTKESDPVKIEYELMKLLPKEKWTQTSHVLIFHGRSWCKARVPQCSDCPVLEECPRKGVTKSR
ncbi:MAG: endonuclease III [Desulfuromonas sp.]|nr:MAG: endonuclease III [Desulfuromonas sp.]